MVDSNVIQGAAIAIAGLGAGIGLVVFTEAQGERAKERGSNLSDNMTTKLAGQMMEDVEVSSVSDISSLTSQLEAALKETGGAKEEELELSGKFIVYRDIDTWLNRYFIYYYRGRKGKDQRGS